MTPYDYLAAQMGHKETEAAISDYLKTGGQNLDPATTAWCAAAVNSALQQAGQKGTGSNMAKSFLNWGEGVNSPQPGDIGVLPRGDPNGPFGHVGIVESVNPDGTIALVAGNQGDAVSRQNYKADQFLGFRRGQTGSIAGGGSERPAAPPTANPMARPEMAFADKIKGYFDGTYKPDTSKMSEGIAAAFAPQEQAQMQPAQFQPSQGYQAPDRIAQAYALLKKTRQF